MCFFKEQISSGSGWGWLGWNKEASKLQVATCQNQDPLEATTGLIPLLGIDVWEHAYYIDYKNASTKYLENIWRIINWQKAEERLIAAQAESAAEKKAATMV